MYPNRFLLSAHSNFWAAFYCLAWFLSCGIFISLRSKKCDETKEAYAFLRPIGNILSPYPRNKIEGISSCLMAVSLRF